MEATDYAKFILALLFVLALIGLLTVIARRFGMGPVQAHARRGMHKRLGVIEVQALDPKRRLVLLRRDDVEHLVILGQSGETVVETGITPPVDDGERGDGKTNGFSAILKRTQTGPGTPPSDTPSPDVLSSKTEDSA